MTVFDDLPRMLQRAQRFVATGTVHGKHAYRSEPPLLELALEPLALKVFGLTHKMHHTRARDRNQRVVDDGQMIRRDNRSAFTRDVLQTGNGRAKAMPGDETESVHKKPIQHLAFLPFDAHRGLQWYI